jgi:hypothetical protein
MFAGKIQTWFANQNIIITTTSFKKYLGIGKKKNSLFMKKRGQHADFLTLWSSIVARRQMIRMTALILTGQWN